jgi:hypothetical protein
MKTRLIFLVLLIVCFACGTNNKPVSDAQKEKIKGEVKEVVNTFLKGAEEANFDMAMKPWLDSPDFIYIYNGVCFDYKGIVDAMKPVFSTQINQKVTIKDEKYAILDKSTVIYTLNCTFLENYKDGHAVLEDPAVIQITFRKINDKWMAICGLESSVRQNAKNTETSKELNQVELMKQCIAYWKCESKDTTFIIEDKYYGGGHDVYVKWETKGKIIREMKTLVGYDKKNDILIESILDHKSPDMWLGAMRFTSTNKFEEIALEDISNPEKVTEKWTYELKSPDLLIETYFQNNKVISVHNYKRVKQ